MPAPDKPEMTGDLANSLTATLGEMQTRDTSKAAPTFLITETEVIDLSCLSH